MKIAIDEKTNYMVKIGERVIDFRGDIGYLKAVTRERTNASGKVVVSYSIDDKGNEYYDKCFNIKVIEVKENENKYMFVERLQNIAKYINKDIISMHYRKEENAEEYVDIYYITGYKQKICVTADSLYAISLDVLRSMSK